MKVRTPELLDYATPDLNRKVSKTDTVPLLLGIIQLLIALLGSGDFLSPIE